MRAKILVAAILALSIAACDDDGDGGFAPQDQFLELSSPENVLINFAVCHNKRDYEHMAQILRGDVEFILLEEDRGDIPEEIFARGVWYAPALQQTMHRMLDMSYIPCDSLAGIKRMKMSLELSGTPTPSNLEGAPYGTLEGRADLDFTVETIGRRAFRVRSRPYFFFTPDSSHVEIDGVTWQLWRIVDMPNVHSPDYSLLDGAASELAGAPPEKAPSPGGLSGRTAGEALDPLPVEHSTWGVILAFFSRPCD
jgi:hypothetical protein